MSFSLLCTPLKLDTPLFEHYKSVIKGEILFNHIIYNWDVMVLIVYMTLYIYFLLFEKMTVWCTVKFQMSLSNYMQVILNLEQVYFEIILLKSYKVIRS